MTKQTARKWTFKGTSASLAVVMAFGMPALTTTAMAEEGQSGAIVAVSGVGEANVSDASSSAVDESSTSEELLLAAAAYSYGEHGEAYDYTASASVVKDGSLSAYYDASDFSGGSGADAFKPVMDDMARYLGALRYGSGVEEITYGTNTYEWNETAGLAGSNWVIKGTSDQALEDAIEGGTLSDYTLVGQIVKAFKSSLEQDQSGIGDEKALTESADLNLKLSKDSNVFDVSLSVEIGSAENAIVDAAAAGSVVSLNEGVGLTQKIDVTAGLTINGNGNTITGQADDASVFFNVTGGTFAISNANLKDFGGSASTVSGTGAIKVPDSASADTKVVSTDVDFSNFNRSAFDIQAGSFEITGGTIDCGNASEDALTKGIKAGGSSQKVTGTVSGTTIENSVSNYEEWDTAAIEVYNNADVDFADVKTDNVKHGVHVDNYYFDDEGDVTVDISGDCDIKATENAVRVYGKDGAQSSATVNILGGNFSGNVKAVDSPSGSISIKGGTFSVDPSSFVASGYTATESDGGVWTVAEDPSAGGGSGGSGGGGTDVPPEGDTVTNEDGSTTTTVTEEDGSTTATTEAADGSASTVVKKDPEGTVTSIEATVAGDTAPESTVALPMEPVSASQNAESAVSISVKAPEGTKISVPVAESEGSRSALMGCVLVMVDADGNEIPMPKTGLSDSGLSLEIPGDCTLKVVDASADFPDMSGDEWFAEKGVSDFVSSRGIMTGVEVEPGSFEFQGDESTNRGMFVTMLHRLELEPSAEDSEGFSDVDASSWYANSSSWAVETGVTTGYVAEDGSASFEGDGEVSREQMATFLYRYAEWLGMNTSARADISDVEGVSEWASEALSWAVAEGLIQGDDETGEIRPGDGATRAEAAVVIMRMVELFYE